MREIEKYIYGLAADFKNVYVDVKKGLTDFCYLNDEKVRYSKDIAFTLGHEPKEFITSILTQSENGELILVEKDGLLFFRFSPKNEHGNRIFRYVKQRKLRQCSYMYKKMKRTRDLKNESKCGVEGNERIYKNEGVIYEICLTNTPRDTDTFCTTDKHHPRLKWIVWEQNITLSDEDHWREHMEWDAFGQELKDMGNRIEQLDRQLIKMEVMSNGNETSKGN
ncbi:hypothetical protein [Psychrobacillus antarcticus]|uniref:hypothetical protein n=1 Tax=Psychrobacillus antarcticus TaxID=2879115 RepID=UPI00240781D3|nr:hypothetical protein [Psychrobacillus antarcticus]